MKKVLLFGLIALMSFTTYGQRNCSTMEVLERLQIEDPGLTERMSEIEKFTQNRINNNNIEAVSGTITIPVVVHVLYNNSTKNISDNQINSQIQVLNDDFRRLNADKSNTPTVFQGVAADVEIEFCLASVDPTGNSTTGITRTSTNVSVFGLNDGMKSSSTGGKDAWPSGSYLNIWVCDITQGYLGYAQFPGGPASTDGVVIDYQYFGTNGTTTAPFNLGRTATHEVGHWLNLRHIWGDGGCNVDDFVNDTPPAGGPNYTGAPCTFPGPNSCRPKGKNQGNDLPDMFQNYMDYSDDVCMNLFTDGQTSRMRVLFDVGGPRSSLLNSNGCGNGGGGPVATCSDGIQNQGETGIDCGGPNCAPCSTGGSCGDPTGLSSQSRKGGREAILSWNAVTGASAYNIEVYQGASLHASGTISGTSATVGGLSKNTSYTWNVTANCNGTLSNTVSASFTARTMNDLVNFEELTLYPNPANDMVSISFYNETASTLNIQVMDMTGRLVMQTASQLMEGNNTAELNVSDLSNGIYMISIEVGDKRVNRRLVKN